MRISAIVNGAERRWTGLASLLLFLSSRLSLEVDFVGVVEESIADRIGDRGLADVIVPVPRSASCRA